MISNDVLTYYYRRYKFIGLSVNDFNALLNSSCEGLLNDDDISSRIIETISDYCYSLLVDNSSSITGLIKKSIKCLNLLDLFDFFDNLIKKYSIKITKDDILYVAKLNELKEFYNSEIQSYLDKDDEEKSNDNLLNQVLNTYGEFVNTYDDELPSDISKIIIKDIEKCPVLTPDQEKDLFNRLRCGEDVKNQIIQGNLRLVKEIVFKTMRIRGVSKDYFSDLFQEGYMGLDRAVELFDINRDNKFSTYAVDWIKSKVNKFIDLRIRNIYIPAHKVEEINKLCKIMNQLNKEGIDNPSVNDIMAVSDFTEQDIIALRTLIDDTVSLDTKVQSDDKDADTMLNFVKTDENKGDYVEDIYKSEKEEALYRAISMFDKKTRDILTMNFGLKTKKLTQPQIAHIYGVKHQRISAIIADALDVLKIILRDYSMDYDEKPIYEGIALNFDNYDESVNLHKRFECFSTFLKKIENKGITVLELYVYDYKVKIKCNECGYEQIVDPLLLTSYNFKCNECSRLKKISKYQQEISKYNPNLIIVGFEKVRIPAKFKCTCCNCEWEAYIDQVLRNPDCVSCGKGVFRSRKRKM